MHLICPTPQILHNLCFSTLLRITAVPREIENNAYAKFWGKIRCIMGDVQVVNESLKSKFSFIHFVYNLMIGLSGKNIIWLSGKCFWTKEKETWVSANWPSNNWALGTTAVPGETNNKQFLTSKSQLQLLVMFIWTTTCLLTLLIGKRAYNQSSIVSKSFYWLRLHVLHLSVLCGWKCLGVNMCTCW